jgi:predicted permease
LLLARTTARARELGLRLALGAPRSRLLRQLLTEAALLAATGSLLGLLAAVWLARTLDSLVPSFAGPTLVPPSVNGGVVAFTALVATGVTLLAGVAPALYGSRDVFAGAIADGSRATIGGMHATRTRRLLVVAEMALAVVSLVGAGLFYESFRNSRALSPGFDYDRVAMTSVSVTLVGYDSSHAEQFLERVADRLRREPGVTAAAYTDYVPLSIGSGSWENLDVEGYAPRVNENMRLFRAAIGPDYFKVLRIPVLEGRDFTAGDDSAHARVMIVNEAFVRQYLPGRSALGARVRGWGRWFVIVGVVKDTKTYRVTEEPMPYFYVPVRQVYRPEYGYTFLVRSADSRSNPVRAVQAAIRDADPTVPLFNAMMLRDYIEGPFQSQQASTRLLALLAGIASLLAAIGLYGVVAYTMAQRTREIGVRVALGAQPGDVVRIVASQAGGLLVPGLIIGLGAAAALSRVVSSLLFLGGAAGAAVFMFAAGAMIVVAFVATSIPARRAVSVDPLMALRAE